MIDKNPVSVIIHKRREQMKTDKLATELSATFAPSKASWLATSRKESNAWLHTLNNICHTELMCTGESHDLPFLILDWLATSVLILCVPLTLEEKV